MSRTIKLSDQTLETIDKLRAPGQSYNGFLSQLLALWLDIKLNKKVEVKVDR